MSQQQPNDKLSGVLYRIEVVERDVTSLKQQLNLYEPARENDLKLQSIKETTQRIEVELARVKEKIEKIDSRMLVQEQTTTKQISDQREANDKLQIRVLVTVISTIVGLGTAILVGYITHFFH